MKKFINLMYVIICFTICACNSNINSNNRLKFIEDIFTHDELIYFKHEAEEDALYNIWSTKSINLKKQLLNTKDGTLIIKYFLHQGVENHDDIAYIMLVNLHRELNHKKAKSSSEILLTKQNWELMYNCLHEKKIKSALIYKTYKLGDLIDVLYPLDTLSETAVYVDCPTTSSPYQNKDLILKGEITERIVEKDSQYFFKVKVIKLQPYKKILSNNVRPNDTIKVNLGYVKIK